VVAIICYADGVGDGLCALDVCVCVCLLLAIFLRRRPQHVYMPVWHMRLCILFDILLFFLIVASRLLFPYNKILWVLSPSKKRSCLVLFSIVAVG
jgi:cbb3-type cytochrome oxidase subunit 1